MSRITITRQELYDEVWSQPMTRLANMYGISDVGLAKLCKKHDIPRPPRGYWAKLQFGQTPPKTPLPESDCNCEITLNDPNECRTLDPDLEREAEAAKAAETTQELRIEVAGNLRGAHELVALARQELTSAKANDAGLLEPNEDTPLDLNVSKAQLRRALMIMDALLKALEKRGYTVTAGPKASILGQEISFAIAEQTETLREQPGEHDLSGRYEFGHSRYLTKRVPSGRLVLSILDAQRYWANGCRKSWRDARKQKLEDCLNKFVAGLIDVAARKQEHEEEEAKKRKLEAEAERKRKEEAHLRAERRKLQEAEKERLNTLMHQADAWRKSRDLRDFIDAVREGHERVGTPMDADSEIGQWLAWATLQADRLDPLRESPPSILDEKIPDEPSGWSWDRR